MQVENGYRGSVASRRYKAIWYSELKQKPELFKTFIIAKFLHRKEAKLKEAKLQRAVKAHLNPLYTNLNINGERFYNPNLTFNHSEETKAKISAGNKGRKRTVETKKLIGQRSRERASDTAETRQKKSESHIGKKHSLQTRIRIGRARKRPLMFRGKYYERIKDVLAECFPSDCRLVARRKLNIEGFTFLF